MAALAPAGVVPLRNDRVVAVLESSVLPIFSKRRTRKLGALLFPFSNAKAAISCRWSVKACDDSDNDALTMNEPTLK